MSATKIGGNNEHFKTAIFHNKYLFCYIKPNIYLLKTKFAPHKQYFFVFLPLELQKRFQQTKVYHAFSYFAWKETTHKHLKMAASKTLFYSVYVIGTTCFDECFLFYVIAGRHYLLWKINVTVRFF